LTKPGRERRAKEIIAESGADTEERFNKVQAVNLRITFLNVNRLSGLLKWKSGSANHASQPLFTIREAFCVDGFFPTEVSKLLTELSGPVRTTVLVLVTTGIRIGEVLALRWKHVDFEGGILRVREAVYDAHFGTPKTASSIADVPPGPETIAALDQHLKRVKGELEPNALVFCESQKRSVKPEKLAPTCAVSCLHKNGRAACIMACAASLCRPPDYAG